MPAESALILGFLSVEGAILWIVGFLAFSIFLLTLFIFFGWVQIRRIAFSDKDAEKKKREAFRTADEIVSQARAEALNLIGETRESMKSLLGRAERTTAALEEETRLALKGLVTYESKRIEESYEELVGIYRNIAEDAKKISSEAIGGVATQVAEEVRLRVDEFQKVLSVEALRYQQETTKQLEEWRRDIDKELQKYKHDAMERVHDSVYDVLFFVTKRVFESSLDLEAQEDLIIRALEEAKKAGFFNK